MWKLVEDDYRLEPERILISESQQFAITIVHSGIVREDKM